MNTIRHIPISAPTTELADAIREDGAVIAEGLLTAREVDEWNGRLDPLLKKEVRDPSAHEDLGDYMPSTTIFVPRLASRYPDVASIYSRAPLTNLAASVLGTERDQLTLNTTQVIEAHPAKAGANPQPLHRDDWTWPVPAPRPQLAIVFLIALKDFSAETGGTLVIPGSHAWDDASRPPAYSGYLPEGPSYKDVTPVAIELKPGSGLAFLGSMIHAGGVNRTKDRVRRFLHIAYCHAWLRPVENFYVPMSREQVLALSPEAQRLLGYSTYRFELGLVGNVSASEYLSALGG